MKRHNGAKRRTRLALAGILLLGIAAWIAPGGEAQMLAKIEPVATQAADPPDAAATTDASAGSQTRFTGDAAELLKKADALRAEGSFRLALEQYEQLLALQPPPADDILLPARVWALDCRWREQRDPADAETARKGLARLVEDLPADSAWRAEAAESLGDLLAAYHSHDKRDELYQAWLTALKFWQESPDLDAARPRYVALNFKIAEHAINYGPIIPLPGSPRILELKILPPPPPEDEPWRADLASWCLRNVLRVSEEPAHRARALTMLGQLRVRFHAEDEKFNAEAEEYLKQAIAIEPRNDWTDDAYHELGQFYLQRERYIDATELYRRFLELYKEGESPYWDPANYQYHELVTPSSQLSISQAFAPGSHIHARIDYRNIASAALRIKEIEAESLIEVRKRHFDGDFMRHPVEGRVIRTIEIKDIVSEKDHKPRYTDVYLEPLPPGIYSVELKKDDADWTNGAFATIFVSRLAAAMKTDGERIGVFVSDAESGEPRAGAEVTLLYLKELHGKRLLSGRDQEWISLAGTTDADGLASLELPAGFLREQGHTNLFLFARHDGHVTYIEDSQWRRGTDQADEGRPVLYAYSDRPAYRPGEPIHWKALLRFTEGKEYRLPKTETVYAVIRDAQNAIVHEGEFPLSTYGSFDGTFSVDRKAALGVMTLEVRERKDEGWQQGTALARVEEYKLPEYKVTVQAGAGPYRLGTALPVEITAEFYFGGPVAGAQVQVVVHRTAFWPYYQPWREYAWLYEEQPMFRRGRHFDGFRGWPREPEQVVLQKDLTTDAEGKAKLEIGALEAEQVKEARERGLWGYEYRVEARVVDASRREVQGNGTVKSALTEYAAYLTPQQFLYLPGDPALVELKTRDPNEMPVSAEGLMTVFKREWDENKLNDKGEKEPGYRDTKLFSEGIATDKSGETTFRFEPEREGYYLMRFTARDSFGEEVSGETTVFVAGKDSTNVGYRAGGVEIITDKESYQRGETAQVMLAIRRPGAAVWFAVEGETSHLNKVVRPTGTVQLVPIEITEDFEPNVFLTAVSMFDYSAFRATKRVVIPPERRFLKVTIRADKEAYLPGEEANVEAEVHDSEGRPVRTELSLGVADAAVWAIQSDLAADIRQHFWSQTRGLEIGTNASAERYSTEFWRPKPGKQGEYERVMREEIPAEAREREFDDSNVFFALEGAMPMPAAAAAPLARQEMMLGAKVAVAESDFAMADAAGGDAAEPRVRTDFRSTALWLASVETGEDGRATTKLTMPDSLTTWRITSRAADRETRVGEERHEVRTRKPIMVRPQGPRYFIAGDQATLSAIVNNNSETEQKVSVSLEVTGLLAAAESKPDTFPTVEIIVPPNDQRRVDWIAQADEEGTVTIRMKAIAQIDSDAVEKSYPIHPYGIEQFIAAGTKLAGSERVVEDTLTLEIPEARREGSESLTLYLEPTLARAMVNALDYLVDYPYGCVEQTLSRFVPAVITSRVIQQLGLSKPDLEKKLPDLIKAGLDRLYDFQHDDGGWGWWRDGGSDPFMTAYVLEGLAQAQEADVSVRDGVLRRAADYLKKQLVEFEDQPDMSAFILYALASAGEATSGDSNFVEAAFARLWADRDQLNPYTRALFALACHKMGRATEAQTLARNMVNGLIEDKANGTAHWGESGVHYRWSEGGVEATAFGLRALLAIDPQNEIIDRAMTWLTRNRRGGRWKNTRDTAIVIRALADYITARGEDKPEWTATVLVNGQNAATLTVNPKNIFEVESKIEVPQSLLKTGRNEIVVRREGSGVLYAAAWLTYFTREEKIPAAGNEVFVERRFFRTKLAPTLAGQYQEVNEPLKEGDPLTSGERIQVELSIEAKNHYEYIVIEDLKAAGLEPTVVQSGSFWSEALWAYRELRDEKTVFFLSRLPEGRHILRYELRAEVPGVFSALPTLTHAMYVPEIRANSANWRVAIKE